MGQNAELLVEREHARHEPVGCYSITQVGLEAVKERRAKRAPVDELTTSRYWLRILEGGNCEMLVAEVCQTQGWDTQEGTRSPIEELDVVIDRNQQYYLLGCKWEPDAEGSPVVRDVFAKLGNRTGVRALIFSMSGSGSGAAAAVMENAGKRRSSWLVPMTFEA